MALAAGGFVLLSSIDPADTARLETQARQLATSVGIPPPLLVAPAAKLATETRPKPAPPVLENAPFASPNAQLAEILGLRPGTPAGQVEAPAGQGRSGDGSVQGGHQHGSTPSALLAVPGEVGAFSNDANQASPRAGERSSSAPERVGASPPNQAATLAAPAEVGMTPQPRPATVESITVPSRQQVLAATAAQPAPPEQSLPTPPAAVRSLTVTGPTDAADVAVVLRPGLMSPGDQVDVLHTVAQLGIVVRDLRIQIAALRSSVQGTGEKVDLAVADFERRLALAEARGAISAAMGADVPVQSGPPPSIRQPAAILGRSSLQGSAQAQAAAAALSGGAHRFRVQAASPGLAMLSELDRSGGEGSQLQVKVGDQVPGYGKVTAIQQRGSSWMVQTDHGAIQ